MLTEQERKWLTVRKKACARCGKVPFQCSQDQRNACYRAGFPLWDKTTVTFESYRDAAEFEARCKGKMASKPIKSKPCAYGKCPRDYKSCPFFEMGGDLSLPFCRLLCVHIAVEQEMDEPCPKN